MIKYIFDCIEGIGENEFENEFKKNEMALYVHVHLLVERSGRCFDAAILTLREPIICDQTNDRICKSMTFQTPRKGCNYELKMLIHVHHNRIEE
jgi:hypothetical protein